MSEYESKKRNPVCVIYWWDAAYSHNKNVPKEAPQLQVTTGFIIFSSDDYANIATNVNYDRETKTLHPVDGFVIPQKAIVEFRKIGYLENE
jgi:hypothetical protein